MWCVNAARAAHDTPSRKRVGGMEQTGGQRPVRSGGEDPWLGVKIGRHGPEEMSIVVAVMKSHKLPICRSVVQPPARTVLRNDWKQAKWSIHVIWQR